MARGTKPRHPYLQGGHPLNIGLVGAWPVFEGGGTFTRDISGRSPKAAINAAGSGATVWVNNARGPAIHTSGTLVTSNVQIIGLVGLGSSRSSQWSLGGIFNWDSSAGTQTAFSWGESTDYLQNNVEIRSGTIRLAASGGGLIVNSGISPTVKKDYHLFVTCDGTNVYFFVDGISRGSAAASSLTSCSQNQITMGEWKATQVFDASALSLDDFRIYNRPMRPSEVLALYNTDYSEFRPSRQMLAFSVPGGASAVIPVLGGLTRRGITGGRLAT